MTEPLRVAIVGAGWMGHVHARAWERNPRARIAAVADISPERAESLTRRHGSLGTAVFHELSEVLEDGRVDAVDLCLPHDLHAQAIVAAATQGRHVLCEKPLCITLEEAGEIRHALQGSDAQLVCAHNKLFTPSFVEARRLVEAGAIGDVVHVQANEISRNLKVRLRQVPVDVPDPQASFDWRLDGARMGGSQLIDTGWHAAYRLLALAQSRPLEVSAFLGNHLLSELPGEDTARILVHFDSGAQGMLLTSWAFGGAHGGWEFEVAGTEGTLAGDATRLVYARNGEYPVERRWETRREDAFAAEIRHFTEVVLDDVPAVAGWSSGARTLQLVLGAYKSAAERRVVSLAPDPTALELDDRPLVQRTGGAGR